MDIYAPGVNVLTLKFKGSVTRDSGTSMSAPHVAGAGASMKRWGDVSSSTLTSQILNGSTPNVIQDNPDGTPNRLLYFQAQ